MWHIHKNTYCNKGNIVELNILKDFNVTFLADWFLTNYNNFIGNIRYCIITLENVQLGNRVERVERFITF